MDRSTIKTVLGELMRSMCNKLTFPAIALTYETINEQFKYRYSPLAPPSIEVLKEIGAELGWEFRVLKDYYAKGPALVRILEPDLPRLAKELERTISDENFLSLSYLKRVGLLAAFNNQYNIEGDPEGIISEETWKKTFDNLGFIYEAGHEKLITKTLDLPANAQELMREALADLTPTEREPSARTNYQTVQVIVEEELRNKLGQKLGTRIGKIQWRLLLERELGEALVKAGYSLEKEWVYANDTTPRLRESGNIFLPAQIIRSTSETPDQFAKGFPIHVPAAITDGTTLVYLELLGPRQAVKANWAAVRSGRKVVIREQGSVIATKEDGFTTLKTTLRECGLCHWALIHGQASCDHLVVAEDFYVIDKGSAVIPSNFYAQLTKAASFPVLPHWEEYLWVQGQMNDLITGLGGTGLGAWKVFFIKEKWEEIVSKGLEKGKIKIRRS